eukprot:4086144-Pleurochrysis_carterae.AAC.2
MGTVHSAFIRKQLSGGLCGWSSRTKCQTSPSLFIAECFGNLSMGTSKLRTRIGGEPPDLCLRRVGYHSEMTA